MRRGEWDVRPRIAAARRLNRGVPVRRGAWLLDRTHSEADIKTISIKAGPGPSWCFLSGFDDAFSVFICRGKVCIFKLKLLGLVDSSSRQKKKHTQTQKGWKACNLQMGPKHFFSWYMSSVQCLEEWSDLFFWVVYSV